MNAAPTPAWKGAYGFVLSGTIVGLGPFAIIELATFDGAGNWTRTETANINGHVLPPETITGTYSINEDCTGSTSEIQGHSSALVLVDDGNEILSIGTESGTVLTVTLKKQSARRHQDQPH